MPYYDDMRKLKELIGNLPVVNQVKDGMLELVETIHKEVHTKVDIHDVAMHENETVLTMERQINRDLHDACKMYDDLLIEIKAHLLGDNGTHTQSEIIGRINSAYGTRIKAHDRSHLVGLQLENEKAGIAAQQG